MNTALRMTAAYFDSKGFKYQIEEDRDVMRISFGKLDNKDGLKILVFFDEDNRTVAIRSFDYVSFPESKIGNMYALCSKMNKNFRWVKFYVDEEDNTITISDDAVVMLDSVGDELYELVMRMTSIADTAYPEFMKAVWA